MAISTTPLLLLIFGLSIGAVSSEPVINSEEQEVTISRSDNYTLSCKSDVPTKWTFSDGDLKSRILGYIHDKVYVSTITIYRADDSDVGFYTCYEERNEYNYVSIYIYVEDDRNLYVGQSSTILVSAIRDSTLVIPCRPTSPSVTVKLYESNENDKKQVEMNYINKDGSKWTYNPKKGFVLSKVTRSMSYFCTFSKGHTDEVPVKLNLQPSPPHFYNLIIHTRNKYPYVKEGDDLRLACRLRSVLTPRFIWIFNGTELKTDQKYTITVNDVSVYKIDQFSKLIIHNLSKHDSGKYTCQVNDGFEEDETSTTVRNILSTTEIQNRFNFRIRQKSIKCVEICTSIVLQVFLETFPAADIKWLNNRYQEILNDNKYKITRPNELITLEISNVTLEDRGNYTIIANNVYSKENRTIFLNVEGKPTVKIINSSFHLRNEEAKMKCEVRGFPKPKIYWILKSCLDCEKIPISSYESENNLITFVSTAVIKSNQSVYVQCFAKNIHGDDSNTVSYIVKDPEVPNIVSSNMDGLQHELIYPSPYNFTCYCEGFPKYEIAWYKDNQRIQTDNRIKFHNNNQTLEFTWTEQSDEGEYMCNVMNKIGSDQRTVSIIFTNKVPVNVIYIVLVLLAVVFLIFCIGLIVKLTKKWEFRRALKRAGLLNFEKGAIESINPNIAIHDQANLLPYDREKWEISKHHITLGQQLGAGQFGVVMKGVMQRYNKRTKYIEAPLTVAVKMINNASNDTHLRALVSELKVMAYLGKHLNIISLIGAWTKHLAKRELYVIVEYCRYGNLHDYLLRHRHHFINQIDPVTEKIDYKIGVDILMSDEQLSQDTGGDNKDPNDSVSSQRDETLIRKNGIQLECEYGDNYKKNVKPTCTKDLLIWAYQISMGMDYLVTRKILHGDLAARNILLTNDNIVKISDFGLSKNMYQSDYKKKGDVRLPVKWMSVEAIRDRIFSTASDVWSFGIVLWEFFSLAETPYPGMDADDRLFKKLVDGYRMDCPIYATKEIHSVMLSCWEYTPSDRPSFEQLSETIGSILEASVKMNYVDLNVPYAEMNAELLESEKKEYSKMVDSRKITTSNYIDISASPKSKLSACIYRKSQDDCQILTLTEVENKDDLVNP